MNEINVIEGYNVVTVFGVMNLWSSIKQNELD